MRKEKTRRQGDWEAGRLEKRTQNLGFVSFGKGVVLFLIALVLNLQLLTHDSVAASLQTQGHGARQVGLGEAVTAAGAQNAYGIYYNPAQLSLAANPEVSMDYAKLLLGLADDSNLDESYIGFIYPWQRQSGGHSAAGFAYSQFSLEAPVKGSTVKLFSEEVLYGSYSRSLEEPILSGRVQWGVTGKRVQRSYGSLRSNTNAFDNTGRATGQSDPLLSGNRQATALSFDTGATWVHSRGWSLGAVLGDVMEPVLALDKSKPDRLKRSYRFGAAYQSGPYMTLLSNFELKNRLETVQDQRFSLGAERLLPTAHLGSFGFRGSLGLGNRSWKNMALGATWRSNAVSIDYGFQIPLGAFESVQGNHRMSLTIRFGEAPPEEEIMELYRKERKARERLEKETGLVVRELERLLKASEGRAIATEPVVAPSTPAVVEVAIPTETKKAPEPQKVQAAAGEGEFIVVWKFYQDRKKANAPRAELIQILRPMMDEYGRREQVRGEWTFIQEELSRDQKDFQRIWSSYKRLSSMDASREILLQALQRIVKRFDGSGVDITEVRREIDRVRAR